MNIEQPQSPEQSENLGDTKQELADLQADIMSSSEIQEKPEPVTKLSLEGNEYDFERPNEVYDFFVENSFRDKNGEIPPRELMTRLNNSLKRANENYRQQMKEHGEEPVEVKYTIEDLREKFVTAYKGRLEREFESYEQAVEKNQNIKVSANQFIQVFKTLDYLDIENTHTDITALTEWYIEKIQKANISVRTRGVKASERVRGKAPLQNVWMTDLLRKDSRIYRFVEDQLGTNQG